MTASSIFFDKNTGLFTLFGVRRFLRLLAICPELLKTLSEGTLVPQIQRYFLANYARLGNLAFHHSREFVLNSIEG